jgi:cell cycle checkpoint protein
VHKKKVGEVRDWLLRSVRNGCTRSSTSLMAEPRIALLTGPSGSGKSATVRLVAAELALEVVEWINPPERKHWDTNDDGSTREWDVSVWKQFQEFILRVNRYKSLPLSGAGGGNRIVLVEDVPNSLYHHAAAFQDLLRQFARTSRFPLIFIMSNSASTSSGNGGSSGSSTKPYQLFPRQLLDMNIAQEVKFNPVAQTALVKALSRISDAESRLSALKPLSKESIAQLAESSAGDIRCAINSLQFLSLHGRVALADPRDEAAGAGGGRKRSKSRSNSTSSTSGSKKRKGLARLTAKDDGTIQSAASFGRDNSLVVFHALGKILNAKRFTEFAAVSEAAAASVVPLPAWAKVHERLPLRSELSAEVIIEQAPVGPSTFTLFLQENYLPFFSELDDVVAATEFFSDADVLNSTSWEHRHISQLYSSAVAARGLVHSNLHPATGSWRPLFKPRHFNNLKVMSTRNETIDRMLMQERHHNNPMFDPANATSSTVTRMEVLPTLAKMRRTGSSGGSSSNAVGGGNTAAHAAVATASSALAALLHETGSYPKMPNARGSTFDKEADVSSEEDETTATSNLRPTTGGTLAPAAGKGFDSTRHGGGGSGGGSRPTTAAASQLQASTSTAIHDDIDDDDSEW